MTDPVAHDETGADAEDFSWLETPAVPEPANEDDFAFLDDGADRPDDVEPVRPVAREDALTDETGALATGSDALSDPSFVPEFGGETREPDGERGEAAAGSDAARPVEPASESDHLDGHIEPDEHDRDADFSWLESDLPAEDDDNRSIDRPIDFDAPSPVPTDDALPRRPIDPDAGFRVREKADAPVTPVTPAAPWIMRLREGLSRSSNQLTGSIGSIFTKRRLDEDTLQDFEDVLIQADLGVETAIRITGRLSEGRFGREIASAEVRRILAEEVEKTLAPVAIPLELDLEKKPHVILVVGVNGTGKTTTIGKLAAKLSRADLKVTLCAGDTFRAAAVEQLKIWGERTGSEVVAKQIGADAAGLAFEAYDRAVENGSDVLIIDTAGRLQNRTELMAELEKIVRVLQKREPDAPHTVLQTLDATTGQNALSQVEIFRNVAGVNGLVMTKLDGTARGGILVAIAAKHKLPVYFLGVGEGIDDLEPFKAKDFAGAIAGTSPAS